MSLSLVKTTSELVDKVDKDVHKLIEQGGRVNEPVVRPVKNTTCTGDDEDERRVQRILQSLIRKNS